MERERGDTIWSEIGVGRGEKRGKNQEYRII